MTKRKACPRCKPFPRGSATANACPDCHGKRNYTVHMVEVAILRGKIAGHFALSINGLRIGPDAGPWDVVWSHEVPAVWLRDALK